MWLLRVALLAGAVALSHGQALEKESNPNLFTKFDGQDVPPLIELTPSNWADEVNKTRHLMVKHYSPYCPHCIDFAPTFQTLYEFYYTSKVAAEPAASFLDYYSFRFGTVNCVAYYDFCEDHGIKTFPTTALYKDAEAVATVTGAQNMTVVSNAIEEALDKYKTGSRPKHVQLPEPGANRSPNRDRLDDNDELSLPSQPSTSMNLADARSVAQKTEVSPASVQVASSWFGQKFKVPTAAQKFNEQKPKKPTLYPNSNGVSVSLTAESFQKLVTMTQDPWFIKFYMPWCSHCLAMAPAWEQLAKSMKGKLNVGEVNCEKERRLCKDIHAKYFPTILFFKGGERAEYHGLRGLGDFVSYADKAIDLASGIPDVNADEFKALEEKEEVIFIYFYDHATTTEDFMALERLPLSLIGHAKLVKTDDPKLYDRFKITTWPRLLVSREGRPTYYTPLTPDEMRDVRGVLDWMRSVWLPLVPELTAANARQIMEGKIVALGILDREDQDTFQGALREMKSAANEWMDRQIQEFQLERKKLRDAKQMRIEEAEDRDDQRALRAAKAIRINMDNSGRKEVLFAWVDGAFWQRWIRTTFGVDVKDGERVIINDQDSRKYWDKTVTGNHILVSRTSIMETLDKVVYSPQVLKPKLTVSSFEKIFFDIRVAFSEHPYLSFGCVAGIVFGAASWLRGRRRSRGYFRLDDNMGINHFKDGLLGQNGNTKAD